MEKPELEIEEKSFNRLILKNIYFSKNRPGAYPYRTDLMHIIGIYRSMIYTSDTYLMKGVKMHTTAKLFTTGRSQAIRLPKEFRFPGAEVFIRRDPVTGEVILSPKPASWAEFFELADHTKIPGDFMADREDLPNQERDLF